jgi:hypothetical protein
MELAFPTYVRTWWSDGKLYIHVKGEFQSAGQNINILSDGGQIPVFRLLIGYDGAPYTGNIYRYDETIWFNGPYVHTIRIIDGTGIHDVPVPTK